MTHGCLQRLQLYLMCEPLHLSWNQTCSTALVSSVHLKPGLSPPPVGNKHDIFWSLMVCAFIFFKKEQVMDTTQAGHKQITPKIQIWFTFTGNLSLFCAQQSQFVFTWQNKFAYWTKNKTCFIFQSVSVQLWCFFNTQITRTHNSIHSN